ncbi:MAG TPA: VWA domain-containing protein, partial [Armatimonadetes bacterium]|nr:VWA domain-containing protein [Armatimonadota bacterium]
MTKCRRMDVLACHFGIGALFLEARIEWGMPNPWFIAVLLLLIGIAIYGYLRERRHWHSVAWTAALVMRILALAVVGLILSPTALRLQSATATKPIVHVLIDNSHSIVIPASDNQVGKGIRALFEQNGALNLRQLSNATKVHLWAFDKSLYALSAEKLSKLQWDGSESKLLNALNEIIDRIPQSNPQPTIIVITDGQDTTMGEISRMQIATLAQRARGHANFIIVGVGRKKQPSNVKIELTPRYAISFPNAIITIQAVARLVQGDRYQGKLTITRGTRIIAQRDIALDANQREAQVDIDIMPRRGANVIKAQCSVASDETLIEDNVAFGVIDVINRNLRLLYLEGAPRWEYKFTKRAF